MTPESYRRRYSAVAKGILTGQAVSNTMALVALQILEWDDPDQEPQPMPGQIISEQLARDMVAGGMMTQETFDQALARRDSGPTIHDIFVEMSKPRYGWMMPVHPDGF